MLFQARASLRADPTATIAWLKQYPQDAQHQGEMLAMVDEAAGRGVARHIWRTESAPADVTFTFDDRALVIANRDGTLVRADVATGARRELGAIGKPWLLVRSTPGAVVALAQDGGLHRVVGDGALERRQSIAITQRAYDMYFVPRTNELKVVFPDDEATFVPLSTLDPARLTVLPKQFDHYEFLDDENTATIWYIVQPTGELFLLDPEIRKLWAFARGTWIRSSDSGEAYLAIVPGPKGRGMGDGVTIWSGKVTGEPPVQLGAMRACAPGDDRAEDAVVTDDGRVAVVKRCGSMVVFTGGGAREIEDAERIDVFWIAPDRRSLVIGRSGAIELMDLASSASRWLAGASTIANAGFSPSSRWVYSVGEEQGIRVWSSSRSTDHTIGKLGESAAPARIVVVDRPGELAILRHLECSHWRVADRASRARFGITSLQSRDLDEPAVLWPFDISVDGRAVSAGLDGTAIVATQDGAHHVLPGPDDLASCVLGRGGTRATCLAGTTSIATFDVATGSRTATHAIANGTLRGLASYRGAPVALVARTTGCTLEDAAGAAVATLSGSGDCRRLRASNATHPGRESALLVTGPRLSTCGPPPARSPCQPRPGSWRSRATSSRPRASRHRDLGAPHPFAPERTTAPYARDRARRVVVARDARLGRRRDRAPVGSDDRSRALSTLRTRVRSRSSDGGTLFTTDGRTVVAWSIDLARGATPGEVRARLDELTTAQIIDGRVATP